MKTLLGIALVLLMPVFALGASATFQWSPVTTNQDGTPCTDLSGYNVYETTSTRTKLNTMVIPTSACTGTPVVCNYQYTYSTSLDAHTFVCTAIDTTSHESGDSNTATAVINPHSPTNFIILFQ